MYETNGVLPPNSERLSPAFAGFYEDTHDYALRYANTLTDSAQAEEVVSEVVTNTWLGVAEGRVEFSEAPDDDQRRRVKNYLFTAIRHSVAEEARKATTYQKNAPKLAASTPDTFPSVEQQTPLFADEVMVCVGAVLNAKDMEMLRLVADGLSTREAAEELGMKEVAFRSRLCRARSRLKDNPAFSQLAAEYGY